MLKGKKVKLFTLSANVELAKDISKSINLPLSEVEVVKFADGEFSVNIVESVRGHDVFIVQPTSRPANDTLMELLIMADALKRASARTINVLMPYYGYSRQDRKAKSREPITAKLVANLLQVAGITRIVSIDLHAGQIQGFFDIPIDNFSAMSLLASYAEKNIEIEGDIVVVSPDHGGVTRARNLARKLEAPLAIIDKRRPSHNQAEVMNIVGDVENKVCFMIDDIIDTAGTIVAAANALKEKGAKDIYVLATHPILSGDATQIILNSPINKVIVTNTIHIPEDKLNNKIIQVSMGRLLGKAIIHLVNNEPISQIFDLIESNEI